VIDVLLVSSADRYDDGIVIRDWFTGKDLTIGTGDVPVVVKR
jgi:hypothetical protein